MVPTVVGHEELPAVTRIVVPVRTSFVAFDLRATICAFSKLELAGLGIVLAGEVQRCGDGNEFAFVDWTNARLVLDEGLKLETGIDRDEANRQERKAGSRTLAGLVFEYAFFTRRGANVGDGRQFGTRCWFRDDDANVMQCREVAVVDLRGDVIAGLYAQVLRLVDT